MNTDGLREMATDSDIHVIPENDLREHEESRQCWCRPTLDQLESDPVVVIHNSADGRELVERNGVQ